MPLDVAALIARALLTQASREEGKRFRGFAPEAERAILAYAWPGNVRQLLSAVRRAVIMADGNRVGCEDLGLPRLPELDEQAKNLAGARSSDLDLRSVREAAERTTVVTAIARTNGNLAKAAELLGVSRPTLYDLMRRLAIQ